MGSSFFQQSPFLRLLSVLTFYAIFLLFFVLNLRTFSAFGQSFAIDFFFMMIFFWSVFRPKIIHPFVVFFLSLLYGIFIHAPLGLHAILYIVAQYFFVRQRIFLAAQSPLILSVLFSISLMIVSMVEWLVLCITSMTLVPVISFLFDYSVNIIMFPFMMMVQFLLLKILHKVESFEK